MDLSKNTPFVLKILRFHLHAVNSNVLKTKYIGFRCLEWRGYLVIVLDILRTCVMTLMIVTALTSVVTLKSVTALSRVVNIIIF